MFQSVNTSSASAARTIAVTGGRSGIGAATTARLRSDGHRVITVGRRECDVIADLSTPTGRQEAVAAVGDVCDGVLDGLVCCAGISASSTGEVGHEGRVISTNFFGASELLFGLQPMLAAAPEPAAVVVSSWTQFRPWPLDSAVTACLEGAEELAVQLVESDPRRATLRPANSTAKIALAMLVRRLAPTAEWAGSNISLNATVPSITTTPMTAARLATPEGAEALRKHAPSPLGRFASADEQADLIAFFASGRGRFITGQVICVDGGLDALLRPEVPVQPLAGDRWPST
ncbi:SDR family oxidoreductase [Rhodococcoides fascians]|uniref:SDR family oxidoreductase n=1 Tax=Rhodococcoides fascians TaxID=1828 RepID=UPI00068AD055|nr:SDR family oxidoreductase [Rhodococcus fascians]